MRGSRGGGAHGEEDHPEIWSGGNSNADVPQFLLLMCVCAFGIYVYNKAEICEL